MTHKLTTLLILMALLDLWARSPVHGPPKSAHTVSCRMAPSPYASSCGECGPQLIDARSDVAGTFTVSLDPATSTGKLLALDSHLVNYFQILASGTGSRLQPIVPEHDPGIIPPYVTEYQPPLQGMLGISGNTFTLSGTGLEPQTVFTNRVVPSFTIARGIRRNLQYARSHQ